MTLFRLHPIQIRIITRILLLAGLMVVLPVAVHAQSVPNGGSRSNAVHDWVDLTGGKESIVDYVLYPYRAFDGNPGAFGIASREGEFSQLTITNPAPEGAFSIAEFGVAVGLNGRDQQPTSTLHVAGGGEGDAYGFANIFIEDRNSTAAFGELLTLENNGGLGMSMTDVSTSTVFTVDNIFGLFELSSDAVLFRADSAASNNSLNLAVDGVGIGTRFPGNTLHVQADLDDAVGSSFTSSTITTETKGGTAQTRAMLNCINNGPSILSMTDTNRPAFSQWLITNTVFGDVDALSLRKNAAGAPNFTIFEDGNIRFTFNGTPNCTIKPNGDLFVRGSVLSNSDRNLKENIRSVDSGEILRKVVQLPITTWNYNYDKDGVPHMGPMAQDFYRAFGLGADDKTIAAMDKDGVALAAIQGLNQKLEARDQLISTLKDNLQNETEENAAQAEMISELTERLKRLEALVAPQQR